MYIIPDGSVPGCVRHAQDRQEAAVKDKWPVYQKNIGNITGAVVTLIVLFVQRVCVARIRRASETGSESDGAPGRN